MKSNKDNQRFHQTNKFLQREHIYPLKKVQEILTSDGTILYIQWNVAFNYVDSITWIFGWIIIRAN